MLEEARAARQHAPLEIDERPKRSALEKQFDGVEECVLSDDAKRWLMQENVRRVLDPHVVIKDAVKSFRNSLNADFWFAGGWREDKPFTIAFVATFIVTWIGLVYLVFS